VRVLRCVRGRVTALSAATLAFACCANALAQSSGAPPPTFGSPPSGEVPIIFSPLDEHVYAKPDTVKERRLLAALVGKNGVVLDPLRSLFEQLGATVSYDPATKTIDAAKPGADVKLTVGKKTITLNGEERPLDVAPEIFEGAVVVPVKAIAEALGAYVAWRHHGPRRIVVVRYVPPPPTPAPALAPTPAASPAASMPSTAAPAPAMSAPALPAASVPPSPAASGVPSPQPSATP
jgi:hypothetical protein